MSDINQTIMNPDGSINEQLEIIVDSSELINHIHRCCKIDFDSYKCKKCPFRTYIQILCEVHNIKLKKGEKNGNTCNSNNNG